MRYDVVNTRDPKEIHNIFIQHLGHDIFISQSHNHTYLWCNNPECMKFMKTVLKGFLILKTYDDGVQNPIGWLKREPYVVIDGVEE